MWCVSEGEVMNNLKGQTCYLAGAIDYDPTDGIDWRVEATKWLSELGVKVFDPCDKPISSAEFREVGAEKDKMFQLKKAGRFNELHEKMKRIVKYDLRMLDLSSFVIVRYSPHIQSFGTIDECAIALRQKKPVLVWVDSENGKQDASNWLFGICRPEYIFSSMEEIKEYLTLIHTGSIEVDMTRWVFFD